MTKHESRLGTEDFGVESNDAAMVGDSPTKSVGAAGCNQISSFEHP